MFPQLYYNRHVTQGLLVYAARLKGELVRAERELRKSRGNSAAIDERRAHYAKLLEQVQAVGDSLLPGVDWTAIPPKVTLLQEYRTRRGRLRMAILRELKLSAVPLTLNQLHERVAAALLLTFTTPRERSKHRAVVMEALHDLRRGPPVLIESVHALQFGVFNQPEQQWRLCVKRTLG